MISQMKGKAIREFLCKELGIPDQCKWFEVRFEIDEPVTVKCEFFAKSPEQKDAEK